MTPTIALHDFGRFYLTPLLTHYFRAVAERITPETSLVCLAREGYLFHRVLVTLRAEGLIPLLEEPIYLKVSRAVLHKALLSQQEVLPALLEAKFQGTIGSLLRDRFALTPPTVEEALSPSNADRRINLPEDTDILLAILGECRDALTSESETTLAGLQLYFARSGLATATETHRLLMLDLGYSGTIQKLLTRLLRKDTHGLYIMASSPGQHAVGGNLATMEGTLAAGHKLGGGFVPIDRSLFYECLLTAPHGQVLDILPGEDGECHFVYGSPAAGQRFAHQLEAVHEGALQGIVESFRHNVEWTTEELVTMAGVNLTKSWAIPRQVRPLFNADDAISGNSIVDPLQLYCM